MKQKIKEYLASRDVKERYDSTLPWRLPEIDV